MLRKHRKYGAFCTMVVSGCFFYFAMRSWLTRKPDENFQNGMERQSPKHVPANYHPKDDHVNSVIRQAQALQNDQPVKVPGLAAISDMKSGDVVNVCFTSDKNTVIGLIAAINSIKQNTKNHVRYHILVEKDILKDVQNWIEGTELKGIDYVLKGFDTSILEGAIKVRSGRQELAKPMNYARFYYQEYFPGLRGKFMHIDDDCIVQGDIAELRDSVKLAAEQIAAFSDDCSSVSKRFSMIDNIYHNFINFRNPRIKELHMKPTMCSFNTGVYVADADKWKSHNITKKLFYWMQLNTKEDIYGNEKGGGGSQPPVMIVLYNKYTQLPPMWHIRYLGWRAGANLYSKSYISEAKLLHWNGRFKPWGGVSQYIEIWDKYFIPDPKKKYIPVRKTRHKS